jgi:ribose 5-phosphate isomerase A
MNQLKQKAAQAAIEYIEDNMILGVGTGSTVNFFIQQLNSLRHKIDACVASSVQTERLLRELNIPVIDLNAASQVDLYVDGADEVAANFSMIKGGGGALTREKIIAVAATKFICIVDEKKLVPHLGHFPIAVEVLPLARGLVAREIVKLGGNPRYRKGFFTDNNNIILDVYDLPLDDAQDMEEKLKLLPGVVETGIFAKRRADLVLIGRSSAVECLTYKKA